MSDEERPWVPEHVLARRREAARQVRRRRRRVAVLGGVALVAAVAGAAVGAGGGDDGDDGAKDSQASAADASPLAKLPRGGRRIFPDFRVVAFYGAPQSRELGVLGIGSPDYAAAKLRRQAEPYGRKTRPVLPAFELITVIANAHPGDDGMYRARQSATVIRRYLRAARRAKALLVLDVQPGHADFMDEVRPLRRWLREPDVGLALDPEWHTPGARPGTVIGSVTAAKVNEVARYVADIVRDDRLPEKLFVVHQFTQTMIADKRAVITPQGLAVTMNVDGFGDRPNKLAKYRLFTRENRGRFHDGYKLFYEEDVGLMKPRSVLALQPPPDLIVYE